MLFNPRAEFLWLDIRPRHELQRIAFLGAEPGELRLVPLRRAERALLDHLFVCGYRKSYVMARSRKPADPPACDIQDPRGDRDGNESDGGLEADRRPARPASDPGVAPSERLQAPEQEQQEPVEPQAEAEQAPPSAPPRKPKTSRQLEALAKARAALARKRAHCKKSAPAASEQRHDDYDDYHPHHQAAQPSGEFFVF